MSTPRVARRVIERDTDDVVPDPDTMARLERAVSELFCRAHYLYDHGERDLAALVAADACVDEAGGARSSPRTLLVVSSRAKLASVGRELVRMGQLRQAKTLESFLAEPAGPASLWLLAVSERGDWYRTRISLTSKQVGLA